MINKITDNLIAKRLIISYLRKIIASFLSDIKSVKQFEKFFITKEQADKKIKELKEKNLPIRPEDTIYYTDSGIIENFYVYQLSPTGVDKPLLGICYINKRWKRGYDDPVCLAGIYSVDENGNETGSIKGYKKIDGEFADAKANIKSISIIGYGKTYIPGNNFQTDFSKFKEYVQQKVNERNKNLDLTDLRQ